MDNTYTSPSISIFILFKKTLKKNPEKNIPKTSNEKNEKEYILKKIPILFLTSIEKKPHTHPFKGLN